MAAAIGNKYAVGAASGRPTKYRKHWHVKMAARGASAGLTQAEIAEMIGIDQGTLIDWCNRHEEFRQAVKVGKDAASDRVERSLYELALAGNVTANIFWLKNVRPQDWRDRHEHEITNNYNMLANDGDVLAAIKKELGEAMAQQLLDALEGKPADPKLLELAAEPVKTD